MSYDPYSSVCACRTDPCAVVRWPSVHPLAFRRTRTLTECFFFLHRLSIPSAVSKSPAPSPRPLRSSMTDSNPIVEPNDAEPKDFGALKTEFMQRIAGNWSKYL
jgi:hypothetical protein